MATVQRAAPGHHTAIGPEGAKGATGGLANGALWLPVFSATWLFVKEERVIVIVMIGVRFFFQRSEVTVTSSHQKESERFPSVTFSSNNTEPHITSHL